MKHLLSIEALGGAEIEALIDSGIRLKAERGRHAEQPLAGQVWAMIFTKSSTRTRVSFEVGVRELGGDVMFLSSNDMQLGRGEPIKDTARVLGRMVHGAIIRTFAQSDVDEFASYSGIPTINALTDEEHPCQILADLMTVKERLGGWEGRKIAFFGDGDCNVARSWAWAAVRLGFELAIAAPEAFQPRSEFLDRIGRPSNVVVTDDPKVAAGGAAVLYTDTWVSMGKEAEAAERLEVLAPYQINNDLATLAAPSHIVQHCLPAYRGKEISEAILEAHAEAIFQEAENRLHAQKAVLAALVRE
ncbi:MAG: ornithine carbamoyltransferase [Akkermansiaceae bacterium]|nr:ornithine carbamoyltransferase [Akkermansiaceae bacterium]MCP5551157.1 ornithine carbamoyltransferase [Akkermansiaceae bacterium]